MKKYKIYVIVVDFFFKYAIILLVCFVQIFTAILLFGGDLSEKEKFAGRFGTFLPYL